MSAKPSVKAILICDQIIQELGTNKKSLIGIFADIHLSQFPIRYPRIDIYVNLTDAKGQYAIEIRILDPDREQIGSAKTPAITIEDPLRTCELALRIQNLEFRKPGPYECQILANDEFLASKTFNVRRIKAPK